MHDKVTYSKFTLHHVRLNQGGYTDSGEYYGSGQPLYEYSAEIYSSDSKWDSVGGVIRADDREHAKSKILSRFPNARFYR